jgi:hypothetical protein
MREVRYTKDSAAAATVLKEVFPWQTSASSTDFAAGDPAALAGAMRHKL